MLDKNPDYGLKWPLWNNVQLHLLDVIEGQELKHYGDSYKVPVKENKYEEFKEYKRSETDTKFHGGLWDKSDIGIFIY